MIVGHVMLDETNFEMKRILFGRLSHTFEFHTGHQPRKIILQLFCNTDKLEELTAKKGRRKVAGRK